jgi:hypothetical protein
MSDDAPKHLREDRYAIIGLLGEGAQAATFDAVDKRKGRAVVIKRFRVRGAKSWKEVELAEREARVLASLKHPNLPEYIEHFEESGELYLVTAKIEGESLQAIRARGGSVSEAEILRFLSDASEALDYLHGRAPPIIHRDIKPSNVIRRPDGSFALIDFGSVRDRMKPEGGSTVVGTFGYMAPEQFQGRAMPCSDVYAVGTTALSLLTGIEPEDLPHKGLAVDVRASLAKSNVSRELERALASMLDPDPDTRASRLAPLLAALAKSQENRDKWSEKKRDRGRDAPKSNRDFRQQLRDEKKAIKKAARAARRMGREARWNHRGGGAPPFLVPAAILGLMLANVAVLIATQVLVPTVLILLSTAFGRGLRDAAWRVAAAGQRARARISRAGEIVRGRIPEDDAGSELGARFDARLNDKGQRIEVRDLTEEERREEAELEREAEEEAREQERDEREERRKRR